MGFFDFLKKKNKKDVQVNTEKKKTNINFSITSSAKNSPNSYVDSSSISHDERPFYQTDSYYTYYSYPGTNMAVRVISFEERKRTTYPSTRGLYVAEIMLLEYCSYGKYPKPSSGYPGFWWFKYGIRDVGHALESLERRGFIQWASKIGSLGGLKVDELKQILIDNSLAATGKKSDLIDRITSKIPEEDLIIPEYIPKYELTELGRSELEENGYVPYMHKHGHLTTEDNRFGETFTVWDINKLFPDGNASNWRQIVGNIEKKRFGVDMANTALKDTPKTSNKKKDCSAQRDEMRNYLAGKQEEIIQRIKTKGDGFEEEAQGLDYKATGHDKEALVEFYVAIGKQFDAPALYRETAVLLRKYGMYEEELSVIDTGLKNIPKNNRHSDGLLTRREKVEELIKKNL